MGDGASWEIKTIRRFLGRMHLWAARKCVCGWIDREVTQSAVCFECFVVFQCDLIVS